MIDDRLWRQMLGIVMAAAAFATWYYWEPLGADAVVINLVSWTQNFRAVETVFRAATFLGDHEFYMIFLSILLWCVDRSLGFWAAVVLLLSGTYTNMLKDFWALPRPQIQGITLPGGYAFPSGHTLTAVTLWGYLAVRLFSRVMRIWMVFAIVAVGISRIVLGYHYPRDVTGGVALGLAFLLVYNQVERRITRNELFTGQPFYLLLGASLFLPLLLYIIYPGGDAPLLMGFLMGAGAGWLLERRWVRSKISGRWYQLILRPLVGLPVMFALVLGLGGIMPTHPTHLQLLLYAVTGLWVMLGAPAVFAVLGLASRATGSNVEARS